jgi:hypothetical protein
MSVRVHDLFRVDLTVAQSRVRVSLEGWDRDLTARVREPRDVPLAEASELLARVAETMTDLIPATFVAGAAAIPESASRPTALGVESALRAREARDRGEDPFPPLDADAVAELVALTWPGIVIERSDEPDARLFELRPLNTFRVSVGVGRRGELGAAVMVGGEALQKLFGRRLSRDADEQSVRRTLAAIEEWLRLSMPGDDILRLPIVETSVRAEG